MNKIVLDSGAYGAANRGIGIDVRDYIEYVKRTEHLLQYYFSLDVIAHEHGRREWDAERIEECALRSYQNQQTMKDAGLCPLPVFHQHADFHWLERYLKDGEPYIALSTFKRANARDHVWWLDRCFRMIGCNGQPRIHGLGVTSFLLMARYPWTSVDSTSWFKRAMYGSMPIPFYKNGQPDFSFDPLFVKITDGSFKAGDDSHIDNMPDLARDRILEYLQEKIGIDIGQARYGYHYRWLVWLAWFRGLEAHLNSQRPPGSPFEIAFATHLGRQQAEVLERFGVRRLLSYFELKDTPPDVLENYVLGRRDPPRKTTRRFKQKDWYDDARWDRRALALQERVKQYESEDE
jgi:hypothetical protein